MPLVAFNFKTYIFCGLLCNHFIKHDFPSSYETIYY